MSNIFEIVDSISEFNELYESAKYEDEDGRQAFDDTLESLKLELDDKAAGYAAVMIRLEMEAKRADELSKKYKAIKASRDESLRKMKDVCIWACDSLGTKELDAGDVKIKVINNGGQLPLIIDDPDKVPQNLSKITIEPDKTLIREYLKDHECDFAHIGERGKHVEVG